jgi:hypothetical protein
MSALVVVVDGEPMEEALAKAFWQRFSAYMDEHKGDLGGFAVQEGLASVHPELRDGRPALIASRQAAQRPYANAPNLDGAAAQQRTDRKKKRGPKPGPKAG